LTIGEPSLTEGAKVVRTRFNPKRRIASTALEPTQLSALSRQARYGGNPQHKRDPGDFGLSPPADPRPDKTLCDDAGVCRRAEAEALLREGLRRGLVSNQWREGWPQNVWAVAATGAALEAQLENPSVGTYHGYPMPAADPLRAEVLRIWKRSCPPQP
jgi:hypothetical protein